MMTLIYVRFVEPMFNMDEDMWKEGVPALK